MLAGCGGGVSNNTVSESTYTGAASAGDLAIFSFDGENLTYNVSGPIFGSKNGSLSLSPEIPGFLYTDKYNNHYFFSKNLGVAEIELDNGKTAFVVGLKDVANPTAENLAGTSGKRYLYIEVDTNGTIEGRILNIKPDKTWSIDGGSKNGTWEVKGNYVAAKDENGTIVANVIVKPGKSRSGIIVDLADGTGFGIGLEQKALTNSDLTGTYKTYYYDPQSGVKCFGTLEVSENSTTYQETWCSDNSTKTLNLTITANQLCNGTNVDGVACADDGNGTKFNMFIDPVEGYFIAINPDTGEGVIGSAQ